MRVLICGSRDWDDPGWIRQALSAAVANSPNGVEVIEGEARGADTIARAVAEELELKVHRFPANWSKYGRSAGPIRNHQMLVEGKPNLVLAFHKDLLSSKGTKNMVIQAENARIPTWRCTDGAKWLAIRILEAAKEVTP